MQGEVPPDAGQTALLLLFSYPLINAPGWLYSHFDLMDMLYPKWPHQDI